jgi:hypothetical protein
VRGRLRLLLLLGLAVLFVLVVLLPVIPAHKTLVSRDAGVFQYIGWRINQGEVPYRDAWDHKPPVIFWINALSLRITQKAGWGIWILEFLSLLAAVTLSLGLLRKLSGTASAILATGIWCVNLSLVLYGGNFTTEFALPLQFACLWLIWQANLPGLGQAENKEHYGWRAVALGVLAALLFFTKQTTVAIPMAWLVYVVGKEIASAPENHWRLAMTLGGFAAGAGVVTLAIAGYFLSQGALHQFWDAAFVFNFYYAQSTLLERLQSILEVFKYMNAGGLVWLAILGWLAVLVRLIRQKPANPEQSARHAVWAVAALALPLEFLFLGTSGKVYYHYFITLIPVLAVFTAALFQMLFEALGLEENQRLIGNDIERLKPLAVKSTKPAFAGFGFGRGLVLVVFGFAVVMGSIPGYAVNWKEYDRGNERSKIQQKVVNEIQRLSEEDEPLLAWGAETGFNFLSQRRSPTRFVYQYPLYRGYSGDYASMENIRRFFEDLEDNPPQVILVPSYSGFNAQEFDIKSAEIEDAFAAFAENYTLYKEIGSFKIYTRNEPGG